MYKVLITTCLAGISMRTIVVEFSTLEAANIAVQNVNDERQIAKQWVKQFAVRLF